MKSQHREPNRGKTYHPPHFYEYGDISSLTEGVGETGAEDGQMGYLYRDMLYPDLKTRP
jgi:hypothetical protein